jgi:hypothetical protein
MYFRAKNTLKTITIILSNTQDICEKRMKNWNFIIRKKKLYDTFRFGGLDSPYIFKLVRFGGLDIVFQWEF